jgi:hypothetical protein
MQEALLGIGIIVSVVSPIVLFIGVLMAIFGKENKKLGIKLIIGSIIAFIIGFATCAANFTLGGHL